MTQPDAIIALYERELNRVGITGLHKAAIKDVLELAARVRELETLLRRVMPEEMGGYPDLFSPKGGWEKFQDDACAALAPTQRDP